MATIDHFLRSGATWVAVFGDGTAARWHEGRSRLSSYRAPLGSVAAHVHVSDPWARVEAGDPAVPPPLAVAAGRAPPLVPGIDG